MPTSLTLALNAALLLGGVYLMWLGSGMAGDVLDRLRRRLGYPEAAGAAFMGMATATPELSVNVTSVVFVWPDLGLGAALGSNLPAIPLAVLLSFLALRLARSTPQAEASLAPTDAPVVKPAAAALQYGPYLLIVALVAALTLPAAWAGLQPIDAAILVAAWAAYVAHALSRHQRSERLAPKPGNRARLLLAAPLIGAGAVASVWGGDKIGEALGLSGIVTGLFIIGGLCALPESFSAWRFARAGHATFGVSATAADGIVSLTLALIPSCLVGAAVGDVRLYTLNLVFLVYCIGGYLLMNSRRFGERLGAAQVAVFVLGYAAYVTLCVRLLTSGAAT